MPSREGKLTNQSRIMFRRAIPLSVEDEVLSALREALGNDLRVERVGEHLGPVLEQSIGRDAGGPTVVVAVGDDLKCEFGLCGVHREDGEVVDNQEVGATVATQRALELTVQLCASQLVEHAGGAGDDDAACGL